MGLSPSLRGRDWGLFLNDAERTEPLVTPGRCTSREWAHPKEHIFLEASVLASIPDLPASPPHFPRCLLQILPTCAILSRICPYKLLQHLGKQGECKQADSRKRAGEAQPTEHLPGVRHRARCFMSLPSLASHESPAWSLASFATFWPGDLGARKSA